MNANDHLRAVRSGGIPLPRFGSRAGGILLPQHNSVHFWLGAVLTALFILAAVRAAGAYAAPRLASSQESIPSPTSPQMVTIYCVASGEHGPVLAAKSIQVPPDRRPIEYALSAMADLPDSPLPVGTQVLSTTIADSGIATIDFNRAMRDSFHGSGADEVLAVDSLRMVMGQFPGVEQVRVTVEGQEIPSIGGNVDLSKPVDVIRSGPTKYYHRQPRYHRKWHWS